MSWSFSASGSPAAVARACREEKDKSLCAEPEETLRKAALDLMASSSEQHHDDAVIRASGSGSMWKDGDVVRSNNIETKVEHLWDWVQ